MRLSQAMRKLEMSSWVSDPQLFCKWMDRRAPPPISFGQPAELKMEFKSDEEAIKRLSQAVSTHMDDFKGAVTEEVADAFMDVLDREFGKLTRQKRKFEHCGILHEQIPDWSAAHKISTSNSFVLFRWSMQEHRMRMSAR